MDAAADAAVTAPDATPAAAPGHVEQWARATAEPGETALERELWVAAFRRLELSDLPGYPSWERAVHDLLHAGAAQLEAIYLPPNPNPSPSPKPSP